MQSGGGKLRGALLAATVLTSACALAAAVFPGAARAGIAFVPCGGSNEYACADVVVPLDPTGTAPGTVTLALRRHLAPTGQARTAVIALAGGPGQAAIPFTEAFIALLGPVLATRDLIVFDARGTGLSGPLSCHAFESQRLPSAGGAAITACAGQIGPARGYYTTLDTVADIEAIRVAGGYEKLVLYGTSYGTKAAELYAEEHPEHVEALVLDSVVPPEGPDPYNRATFAAVARVLRSLCADDACAGITHNPVADLARVVRMTRSEPLRGRVIDGHGHGHRVAIGSLDLFGLLLAGDLAPVLRGELVTSVSAAARGDNAPLARLEVRGEALAEAPEGGFDVPLYLATLCEEEAFPWERDAGPATRLDQARAAIAALPASALFPFERRQVLGAGDFEACAWWPSAAPSVPEQPRLPNVPTLILSGEADLRTPVANAMAVASAIPDAHVLVVPHQGHSVLTTEPTECARRALFAQFAGSAIKPCPDAPLSPVLRPPPLPPTRLSQLAPERGYSGRVGRTLRALARTVSDLGRETLLQLAQEVVAGRLSALGALDSGGLRAGWARYANGKFSLHDYTYVPGVTVSGTLGVRSRLVIGGRAAAHGRLRAGPHGSLVGVLGGVRVRLPKAALASPIPLASTGAGSTLATLPRGTRRKLLALASAIGASAIGEAAER